MSGHAGLNEIEISDLNLTIRLFFSGRFGSVRLVKRTVRRRFGSYGSVPLFSARFLGFLIKCSTTGHPRFARPKVSEAMKQYPPGTEIDIFREPNDWQCQNMWNGCKKLRQLCISSTQYDACAAYVHTTGTNMPVASSPDDAWWQPDQLNRIWVLPAAKCNWEDYSPKSWHAVMLSSVHRSFSDAPAIKLAD